MKKIFYLFILLSLIISCDVSVEPGYIDDDKKTIEIKIEEFHNQYNSGGYEQIIANSHPAFAGSLSKNDLIQAMRNTKNKYGNFQSISNKWINIIVKSPVEGRTVYNSKFDKADTTEMFAYVKEGKAFKLVQYQVHKGTIEPPSDKKE